jgi:hydrogenase nickel incorporation protein HypB
MCLTCGCGDEDNVRVTTIDRPAGLDRVESGPAATAAPPQHHDHHHPHQHNHHHDHGPGSDQDQHAGLHQPADLERIELGVSLLAKNDHLAEHNRNWLAGHNIVAVNLMSSPGSGKTSLLERTITEHGQFDRAGWSEVCVIEGDQETVFDAERIRRAGARAVQVNTGAGCHLDAPMVQRAIETLDPRPGALLFVENVGNLVCPALFDIGERAKVVVVSVTEGDDKPLKYPHMFSAADLVVINKTDLLPYVDFDLEKFAQQSRSLNPGVSIIALSVRDGTNMAAWYEWLSRR